MTPSAEGDEAQLDELYGLPLDGFTPARDGLARELREQGDRARADRIKGLRKPSLVAWALNQVWRHNRDRVEQLLAAGGHLREAQQQLLAGGEHGLLRDAVVQERTLVEDVVRLAEHELDAAGHPANANLQNKLRQTLHAAARDDQTRELLSIGRLLREGQIADFGLGAIETGLAEVEPSRRSGATAPPPAPARTNAGLARKITAAQRRLEQARGHQHELEETLERLEHAAADAGREAALATSAAARAQASADQAGVEAREAAERANELEARLAALESEA